MPVRLNCRTVLRKPECPPVVTVHAAARALKLFWRHTQEHGDIVIGLATQERPLILLSEAQGCYR